MKLLSPVSCICTLTVVLTGCQTVSVPEVQSSIQAGLSTLDFDLDSSSYVVRAGETLDSIAFRYNTTPAQLLQLNPHAVSGVHTGMHINVRPPVGISQQALAVNTPIDEPVIVETKPITSQQAVPVAPLPSDDYLLGDERFNRAPPAIVDSSTGSVASPSANPANPAATSTDTPLIDSTVPQSTGYVQQPGYPVEEVIEDDNFQLPGAGQQINVQQVQTDYVDAWQWPIDGQLARDYDPRRPNGRGIEIIGMPGNEVRASRDGVVDWVARSPDGIGKVVIVRHDDDYLSIYSNAEDLFVAMNETVQQGDPIASLGANANDEPLLRFEISKGGDLLNPMDFLSPR